MRIYYEAPFFGCPNGEGRHQSYPKKTQPLPRWPAGRSYQHCSFLGALYFGVMVLLGYLAFCLICSRAYEWNLQRVNNWWYAEWYAQFFALILCLVVTHKTAYSWVGWRQKCDLAVVIRDAKNAHFLWRFRTILVHPLNSRDVNNEILCTR